MTTTPQSAYARFNASPRPAYRVALACGATPLIIGLAIFGAWLATGRKELEVAGTANIYVAVVLVSLGMVALGWSTWIALQTPAESRGRFWAKAFACAVLLMSNIPVAGAIFATVLRIETSYAVIIRNDSGRPLDGVRLVGGGADVPLGTIAPGASATSTLEFREDGPLTLHASGPPKVEHTIEESVTTGMGGRTTVRVGPDGSVSVERGQP